MPKAVKKKQHAVPAAPVRSPFMAAPWNVRHHNDHSEIEAYVEAIGDWTALTKISDAAGLDAEATSNFIVRAVNAYDVHRHLIAELASALKTCLDSDKLGWKTKYTAELAMRKVEQLG